MTYASLRNASYFQGYFVGKDDPNLSVTVTDQSVTLTWHKVLEFPGVFGPPDVLDERIELNLVRVSRR